MRKNLVYGASAACLALAIPFSAHAEDMMGVSLSGSMKQDIGFGSYSGGVKSVDDVHFETDATINFVATGTTDGGLVVTATVALKGKGEGVIDASHLNIAGGFGAINLGQNGHASNMHGNKGIGGGYGGGGYYDCGGQWTPASCGGPPGNDKGVGIRYSTPSIGGLQVGVSFQPEAGGTKNTSTANDSNIIAVGANFSGDFAGTSLTIGAGWVTKDSGSAPEDGPANHKQKSWGLGATAGIGNTSLHLRYDVAQESHASVDALVAVFDEDGSMAYDADTTSYGIGIDHTIGSLSFGIGYGQKTVQDAVAKHDDLTSATTTGLVDYDQADTKHTVIAIGASYDLGGGVSVSAGIHSGDVENMDMGAACADQDGTTLPVGPNLSDPATLDAICTTGNVYQMTSDVDDVGVGLRIALSF